MPADIYSSYSRVVVIVSLLIGAVSLPLLRGSASTSVVIHDTVWEFEEKKNRELHPLHDESIDPSPSK